LFCLNRNFRIYGLLTWFIQVSRFYWIYLGIYFFLQFLLVEQHDFQ